MKNVFISDMQSTVLYLTLSLATCILGRTVFLPVDPDILRGGVELNIDPLPVQTVPLEQEGITA